jgi:hypothetical protein
MLPTSTLKIEAVCSYKMLLYNQKTAWHNNTEDRCLNTSKRLSFNENFSISPVVRAQLLRMIQVTHILCINHLTQWVLTGVTTSPRGNTNFEDIQNNITMTSIQCTCIIVLHISTRQKSMTKQMRKKNVMSKGMEVHGLETSLFWCVYTF